MKEAIVQGSNIPWSEFHPAISGEDWWVERLQELEKGIGGSPDGSTLYLALMATFNCCRFHADFPRNLLRACEAIGRGKACAGRSCCHVSPGRWTSANEYVAAIQGRLRGVDPWTLADEGDYDAENVARFYSMMGGEVTPAREALFQRYLFVLVNRLKWATRFHLLGDASTGDTDLTFRSFDHEYLSQGGAPYYDLTTDSPEITELDRIIRGLPDGEKWIQKLDEPEQPLCQQRYLRHQDIKISSIGCGEWRGNLPVDDKPGSYYRGLFEAYDSALQSWLDGKAPRDEASQQVSSRLGDATPKKRELVRLFLLRPSYSSSAYYWLKDLDRLADQRGRGY
jgi:hypothetical protein